MPSHIYINTGDYHEGTVANENAVRVDSIYIAQCKVQGVYPQLYYPHNYHFLAATAALEGNGAKSIEAVFKMSEIIGKNYLTEPGYETTQHYITTPYNVLVKFAQWEKILALPEPELLYPKAIWHYARGMAYANTGNLANGDVELAQLKHLAQTEDLKALLIWEINSAADITMIAQHVLEGELFRIREKLDSAASHFKEAIAIEDGLNYNEPPDWFFSVRHYLGDVLLEMLQPEEAEKVFIEDLMQFPRNGFALNGLYYSLTLQGRETDAQEIKNQFEEAWQHADSELRYSRIDPEKRKDLAIRINENSPQELLYVTAAVCGFN
jgi:tetratricopeptide (TPR) repeat protein